MRSAAGRAGLVRRGVGEPERALPGAAPLRGHGSPRQDGAAPAGAPATRHVYRVTDRGHELLRDLLRKFGPQEAASGMEFKTRVAFFHLLGPQERLRILDQRQVVLAAQLRQLATFAEGASLATGALRCWRTTPSKPSVRAPGWSRCASGSSKRRPRRTLRSPARGGWLRQRSSTAEIARRQAPASQRPLDPAALHDAGPSERRAAA
jgi:hypothetical protein